MPTYADEMTNQPDEALIGPNPRDEIIQEIAKIKEKQAVNHKAEVIQWEKTSFQWATKELARRYFGLHSLEYFDSAKIKSLQDLIYEKARKAYVRHTIMLILTPIIGWIFLGIERLEDNHCYYTWPTRKFVKFYKKFRKQEENKK